MVKVLSFFSRAGCRQYYLQVHLPVDWPEQIERMLTISFPSLSPGGLAALISFFVVAVIYLSKLVFALGQLFIFGVRRTGHEWTSLAAAVYGSPLSLFMEGGNPARLGIASKNRPSSSRAVMITIGIATLVALGIGPITQLGLQTCNYNELISADLDYKLSTRPVLSQVANRSVDFDQLRSYRSCPPCTGQSGRFTIDPNYFKTFKELQGPMQLQYTQITDKLFSDGTNGLQAFFESIDLSPSAINSEYVNGMVASREEGWFTIQPIPVFPEDSLKVRMNVCHCAVRVIIYSSIDLSTGHGPFLMEPTRSRHAGGSVVH